MIAYKAIRDRLLHFVFAFFKKLVRVGILTESANRIFTLHASDSSKSTQISNDDIVVDLL